MLCPCTVSCSFPGSDHPVSTKLSRVLLFLFFLHFPFSLVPFHDEACAVVSAAFLTKQQLPLFHFFLSRWVTVKIPPLPMPLQASGTAVQSAFAPSCFRPFKSPLFPLINFWTKRFLVPNSDLKLLELLAMRLWWSDSPSFGHVFFAEFRAFLLLGKVVFLCTPILRTPFLFYDVSPFLCHARSQSLGVRLTSTPLPRLVFRSVALDGANTLPRSGSGVLSLF